jgi:hypothetical protein
MLERAIYTDLLFTNRAFVNLLISHQDDTSLESSHLHLRIRMHIYNRGYLVC